MGQLRVGASRKSIAPYGAMFPAPQSKLNGEALYTSVRKDIFVRAVAMEADGCIVIMITQELTSVKNGERIKDQVCQKTGIDRDALFITATHNHTTIPPVDLDKVESGEVSCMEGQYLFNKYVTEQSVAAALEALERMQPARFGFGKGFSYINVSRDEQVPDGRYIFGQNPSLPSDKTLSVLKFTDLEGKLIAAVLNFGVHSTMCYRVRDEENHMAVSGDLAGEITDFVEAAYGNEDAVVIWQMGAGGDQTAVSSLFSRYAPDGSYRPSEWFNNYTDPFMWQICASVGSHQGADAVKIIDRIQNMRTEVQLKYAVREFMLPGIEKDGFGVVQLKDDRTIDHSKVKIKDGPDVPMRMMVILLGNIPIMGINCEMMSASGMRIRENIMLKNLIVCSLYDDLKVGGKYLVDRWGYENHTQAYYRNVVKDACTEEVVQKVLDEMLYELTN